MTEKNPATLLKQLENTLRANNEQSGWLYLEPIDNELLESIQHALDHQEIEPETQPEQTPQKSVPRTTTRLSDISVPVKNTTTEPTLATSQSTTSEPLNMDPMLSKTLDSLRLRIRNCNRCDLCNERQTVVFGQGNIRAELVFIGEGPGADEDKSGIAFVGKAGKLLTQMIHSIGINRESVFICNVVKCRPPGNRNPNSEEIATCSPFLFKQLEILNPKLIVTMGNIATKTLLPQASGIMKMRGKATVFQDIPLIPTFHPSYLLRNPSALNLVWDDMRQIRQVLFHTRQETTAD
jgi:uracil-DNA glycosylase family 4